MSSRASAPRPARARAGAPAAAAPAASRPARGTARAPHEVRLIGGQWKRSKLPVADRPGLRPTPDRVRETLFNWLGQDLAGWRVLDAFAGSGALGFEAASRGAASVLMLERDAALAAGLRAVKQRLQATTVEVRQADALAWMRGASPAGFDLVLLDPPFDAGLFEPALAAALPLLATGGLAYLEAPAALASAPAGWRLHRQGKAGAVHFHLLQREDGEGPGARGTVPTSTELTP